MRPGSGKGGVGLFSSASFPFIWAGVVLVSGVRFAALTGVVWAGVLIMGRLTAYLGSLYIS